MTSQTATRSTASRNAAPRVASSRLRKEPSKGFSRFRTRRASPGFAIMP